MMQVGTLQGLSPAQYSPQLQRALLDARLAKSFGAFNRRAFAELNGGGILQENWHHRAIAAALEEVRTGACRRLLITMPPRSLKSHMVSVAFPAWIMGHDPSLKLLCTSYSEELAVSFSAGWRQILEAPWYQRALPGATLSRRKNSETEARLRAGGMRLSQSAGGSLTGRGADLIIVDDPLKASDAGSDTLRQKINIWFDETLLSRLNNKATGAIIVVMQRLHPDDLAGHLLERGGWQHLDLPAIAPCDMDLPVGADETHHFRAGTALQPDREPLEVLADLKREMGSRAFAAQYLQRPAPLDGGVIRLAWFVRHEHVASQPAPKKNDLVISVDAASSARSDADYSVAQVWQLVGRDAMLIDTQRGQWGYPDLKARLTELSGRYSHPRILIEQASSGIALTQELRKVGENVISVTPKDSKMQRLEQILPMIESGRVSLPERAPWLADLEMELTSFPQGRHDDQIDAMTQALIWAENRPVPQKPRPIRILM